MRPKIRIYKYLSLFLDRVDDLDLEDAKKQAIIDNKKTIFDYWEQNPDQRLPQVLFNLFSFNEFNTCYYKECFDYLSEIGVPERELFLWGSYGKDRKGPLKYLWLDDIETDHIKAILNTQKLNSISEKTLKKELEKREQKEDNSINNDKYGTVFGKIITLESFCEKNYEDNLTGNFLPDLDLNSFIENFKKHGINLLVDYVENNTDSIFFEIDNSISKDEAIQVMLLAAMYKPDEFDEVSENVFRLWWD